MIEATGSVTAVPSASPADVRPAAPVVQPVAARPTGEGLMAAAEAAVEKALKALQQPLIGQNERLSISRDEETGTFIYRSVDKSTGEVVRQWPAESMLQFKAYLRGEGLAFDHKA